MKWIRFPHIHWHRRAGMYGLFPPLPFWECRCGIRKYCEGVW